MEQNQNKGKSGVAHKLATILGAVLCVLLLPILIINSILIVRSYTNPNKVPSIGHFLPLIVLTDSMYPQIQSGDLIICRTADPEDIAVGDVIAFFDPAGSGSSIVTHQVIEITEKDGSLAWKTKGIANNTEDRLPVPAKNLVGVYNSRVPGLGNAALFMQTTQGLILCVICPIVLLVGYDIIRRRVYEKAHKQDTDALLAELEELRKQKNTEE